LTIIEAFYIGIGFWLSFFVIAFIASFIASIIIGLSGTSIEN